MDIDPRAWRAICWQPYDPMHRKDVRRYLHWLPRYRELEQALQAAFFVLGPPRANFDWDALSLLMGGHGVGPREWNVVRNWYFRLYKRMDEAIPGHLKLAQSRPWRATPGQPVPEGQPVYRSKWELSVAQSLTRLGIAFSYECESFTYPGRDRRTHRYTPDFRLDDFADTFVEVKGPNGPDSVDELKMQRVLKRHPRLTLLLWDADVVEFIEDITEPMFVVQLITTTRLQAA